RDRRRQPVEDLLLDLDVVLVAAAEVEVQNQLLHVEPVLGVEGLVQVELVSDLLDELRVGLAPRPELRRIRRREEIEDHEGDEAHEDEQHHHPEKSANDESSHCAGPAPAPPADPPAGPLPMSSVQAKPTTSASCRSGPMR